MSGPKVITYTMDAFDGQLGQLMRMQTRLKSMSIEMQQAAINDDNLNIHYNCNESYKKIAGEIEKALKTVVFDYRGTFNKNTHDIIEKKINALKQNLSQIIKKSDDILTDFNSKQKDYDSFIGYASFVENSRSSLDKFKIEINDQVNESLTNKNLADETSKKFGTLVFEMQNTVFKWGFDKIVENEKDKVVDHVIEKENMLKEIRQEFLDKILSSSENQNISAKIIKKPTKPAEEIIKISKKIETLIINCEEKVISTKYRTQFNKLTQSDAMSDLFFYQELHDSILERETTRKQKVFINGIIARLNSFQSIPSLNADKNYLLQKAVNLLNCSRISDKETYNIKNEIESFYLKNRTVAEEAELNKKKQHFIKTQIIHNFENLGYEVMDDLEVIDFEKENDFYLKAPGQENLLNIKFKDDGSFRYVFEIPEKKDQLSLDQQKMKLHEMKTTCGDFVNVLNDLKQMGVNIDIKSEKPIDLDSMISIPESISTKLNNNKSQTQRKQQIKKLYLD